MDLTHVVYVALVIVALMVITYWVAYTRRLKTPQGAGTQAGIAVATERREHPPESSR
jgi:hypothetical protein